MHGFEVMALGFGSGWDLFFMFDVSSFNREQTFCIILVMPKKNIRIGIIGAGANTRARHIPGFQSLPGVDVSVVCNRSEASSRKVADEFGIPRIAGHWREVVESEEVDAVMIGTWPYLHGEASVAALAAGKHVLTEARMARSLAEAERMLESSRRHPELVAQVVPAPMSLDVDATVIDILDSGALGEVREVVVTHTGNQFLDASKPVTWRQDLELSGHNVLTMGIYHEMVQRWVRCEPEWVMADGKIFTQWRRGLKGGKLVEVGIPDSISIWGRMVGGARLIYHFSGVEAGRPRNEMRLSGARGGLRFDVEAGQLYQSDSSREWQVAIPEADRRGWRVEADFVDSIRAGTPVRLTSFEDGVKYMRFTEAVYSAWQDGEKIFLCPL